MHFTVDRYVFLEWFKIFVLSLFVTVGLLLIQNIYDSLQDLLHQEASVGQILRYYGALIPSFMPAVIPIGLMASILFSLGSLHRNGEIIALRAAGLSLVQITRSLFFAGILLAGLLFYLNAAWVPESIEYSRNFIHELRFKKEAAAHGQEAAGLHSPFTYSSQKTHQLWVMQAFSEFTYQGFGVNVYEHNAVGAPSHQIVAQEAFFDEIHHHWVFLRGRDLTYDARGEPIRSVYFERLNQPDFTDTPHRMLLLSESPQDLSFKELQWLLENQTLQPKPELLAYALRYQSMLVSPLIAFIVLCLAIPLAVSGIRVSPAVGVSKCVGLFFIYYFIQSMAMLLGEQGHLPLLLAAWLPALCMLVLTGLLYKRSVG